MNNNSKCRLRQILQSLVSVVGMLTYAVVGAETIPGENATQIDTSQLPYLTPEDAVEHTPVSGTGFRTTVLGEEQTIPAWDRRSYRAWQIGAQFNFPEPDNRAILPIAAVYWWQHPEQGETLFYGSSVLVYNDLLFAKPLTSSNHFERVLTFNSNTIPVAQTEVIDGVESSVDSLYWGYIRPGFGLGYREQLGPYNDNMFAIDFIVEPGFLYFGRSNSTASNFITPEDTFEIRTRLEFRWDKVARNILNMTHSGYAAGANLIYGHRTTWNNWGINGQENSDRRNYIEFEAYWLGASGVPFIESDRHRLLGYFHAGVGHNLDRFSAERVGGGPNPKGDSYSDIWRPLLPGAQIFEFFPENYAIAAGEYRWEATFFTYVSVGGGVGTLNPLRQTNQGIRRRQTIYPFTSAQLVSGFLGNTRITLTYTHNWGVVRNGKFDGNEVMAWVAGTW